MAIRKPGFRPALDGATPPHEFPAGMISLPWSGRGSDAAQPSTGGGERSTADGLLKKQNILEP